MQNKIDEFVKLLSQLEAIEVLGLARLLNIPTTTAPVASAETETEPTLSHGQARAPRDGQDILEDIIAAFDLMNRTSKRNLLKLMRQSAKETKRAKREEAANGTPTKN